MTSPYDQPLSRRAARRALEAENAGVESFAQPQNEGARRSGRGSATPASVPSSAPTDMTYRTQVRPRVPHYDERTVSAMPGEERTPEPMPTPPPLAPSATPEHGAERVRRRDFRPPPVSEGPQAPVASPVYDTPLEYHTQLTHRPVAPVDAVATPAPLPHVIDAPATPLPHSGDLPVEHTLSRRELRELRAAQAETVQAHTAQVEPVAVEPELVQPVIVEPELVQPAVVHPAPVVPTSTGSHWSIGIHDDEDPFENTFSREVGSATSLNTNALVLPEMPTGSIAGPVAGTGEIIVTGMIAVSPLHASTGTVPTLHDSPDIDDFFDADDREVSAPDSAPVSALKAISSHTAAHTVMSGKPSTSNTVTTVLVASTVGMAVIAIGLFIVAAVNGLF